jgi:hypothetical protein
VIPPTEQSQGRKVLLKILTTYCLFPATRKIDYNWKKCPHVPFNLSRENVRLRRVKKRTRKKIKGKRFELVISNVLFTSVRISLFTHSLSLHRR